MLKAMTRCQRSVYTHSDPVFQIEWYFWGPQDPEITYVTHPQSRRRCYLIKTAEMPDTAEMPAGFALTNTRSDFVAVVDDPDTYVNDFNTAEAPWLDPLL